MNDVVQAAGSTVNADSPEAVNSGPQDIAPVEARPEWLDERFQTPEDMAASYKALETKLGSQADEIRTTMLEEVEGPPADIPADAKGYTLPEGIDAADAESSGLLGTFQDWAYERELGQADFEELVNFYATAMQPDIETEAAKIGSERLHDLNGWIGANVPEQHYPALRNMMTSAANVEALETIMKLTVPSSLPGQTGETSAPPKQETKQDILNLMNTPGYLDPLNRDPQVVAKVEKWFSDNVTE